MFREMPSAQSAQEEDATKEASGAIEKAREKEKTERMERKALTAETVRNRLKDIFKILEDNKDQELSHENRDMIWKLFEDIPEETFPFKDKANGKEFKIVRGKHEGKEFVTIRCKNKDGSFSRVELFGDGEVRTYSRPSENELQEKYPDSYDSVGYREIEEALDSDKPLDQSRTRGLQQNHGGMFKSGSSKKLGGSVIEQAMDVIKDFNDAVESIVGDIVRKAMGE